MNLVQNKTKIGGVLSLGLLAAGGVGAALYLGGEPPDMAAIPGFGQIVAKSRQKEADAGRTADYEAQQNRVNRGILSRLPLVSTGKPRFVKTWKSLPMVFRLQFSPDGAYLAVGADSSVDVRSTRDWHSEAELPGSPRLAWAPNSRWLAVDRHQGVDIYQMPEGNVSANLADGSGIAGGASVYGPLLFSADSSKLATLGEDPQSKWELGDGPATDAAYVREIALKIWDVKTGKSLLVKPGPSSNDDNFLTRLTEDPAQIEFVRVGGVSHVVSDTRPPIYIFNANNYPGRLFGAKIHPDKPYAAIAAARPGYAGAIAGNAWIYGLLDNQYPGNRVRIVRTRDQKLLATLPFSTRITGMAISPDAKILAVAADHATEQTFPDGSTRELSRSRISIYQLSPSAN